MSVLLVNGAAAGLVAMRDEPREDAVAGLSSLKSAGVKAMMLTGDNKRTAAAVAVTLGIDWCGEMMPEDKQRVVGELKREGFTVAKVGDGINDAPALAAADIGIAMGAAPMWRWKPPMPPYCMDASVMWRE